MTKNKRKTLLVWVLFVCFFSTSLKLCRRNGYLASGNGYLVRAQGIVNVYKTGGLLPSLEPGGDTTSDCKRGPQGQFEKQKHYFYLKRYEKYLCLDIKNVPDFCL